MSHPRAAWCTPALLVRTGSATAVAAALLAATALTAVPAAAATATASTTGTPVYGDGLSAGWSDWSWGSAVQLAAPAGRDGGAAVSYQVDVPWAGLYLHTDTPVVATADTVLEVSVRAHGAGAALGLVLYGADLRPVRAPHVLPGSGGSLPAGQWTTLRVPLAELGVTGEVTGLSLQDFTGTTGQRYDVDDLSFAGAAPPAPPAAPVVAEAGEVRPGNATPNATRGRATDPSVFFGYEGFRPYYEQVDGDFVGTTEEILTWAAAKWGFDELGVADLAKAVAVHETWWRQEHVGAYGELGILQVNPNAWPDSGPAAWSTAYAADYGMAVIRHHYDGQSWLGAATRGDLRHAVAAWYCGCGWDGGGRYATLVFDSLDTKLWQRPGTAPEWF